MAESRLRTAEAPPPAVVPDYEEAITGQIERLGDAGVEVLPWGEPGIEELLETLAASVVEVLRPAAEIRHVPLALRVVELEELFEIASIERVV